MKKGSAMVQSINSKSKSRKRGSVVLWLVLALGAVATVMFTFYFGVLWDKGMSSTWIRGDDETHLVSGWKLGTNQLPLKRGDEIHIEYEVIEMNAGELKIFIDRSPIWAGRAFGQKKTLKEFRVKKARSGDFEYLAAKEGMYVVRFQGHSKGEGYDLKYTANWKKVD